MPIIKNLNKSTRNIIDVPNIIPRSFDYSYETYNNTPKMILVIENKLIRNEILNNLSTNSDKLSFKIDYEEKNPSVASNIFNYINSVHSEMIRFNDLLKNTEILNNEKINSYSIGKKSYKNDYTTNNYNFAYHYFIDKKGNIYEGRPHNIRAYNLDIYNYDKTEFEKQENKQYDKTTGKRILPLLDQGDFLFNDCLVILTEEQTDDMDTTNATYTALKSLITYLKQYYGYSKFYSYSELKMIPFYKNIDPKEDISCYNNPGLFFRINELHSAIDHKPLSLVRNSKNRAFMIFSYGERELKYNKPTSMCGNDILMLQKMLYKLELLKYSDITGYFELSTKLAVSKFQKKYYIKPEIDYGIADKNTLNELRNKLYNEKIKNTKTIDDNYNPYRVLEYIEGNNMTGYDVIILQKRLKKIIYPILEVNGIYDKYTKDAVSMFQSKYGIFTDNKMIDGKVGPLTWNSILACKDIMFSENSLNSSDIIIPGSLTPTHHSISKSNMIYIQRAINKMLEPYKHSIELTGIYDSTTQKYIKMINQNEFNRKTIGLDKYTDKNGKLLDWNNEIILKTCYPAEIVWLIKHYLLNEKIELELVK